jgi:uncharacterized phage-associated protein
LEIGNIFKDKAKEEEVSITNLRILKVLITRLLRQGLNRLVREIKPVKL